MLKFQIKELTAKYDNYHGAEHLIREKENCRVLMQAQEKAETMMEEARSRAVEKNQG